MPDPVREIFRCRMRGYSDTGGFELTALYVDPSGAKVAVGRSERGSYVDAGLVGRHASPAEVFRVTDSLAHVDLMDRDGELSTRILAYVDDPVMYPWYPLKAVGETRHLDVTIGALGTEVGLQRPRGIPGITGRTGEEWSIRTARHLPVDVCAVRRRCDGGGGKRGGHVRRRVSGAGASNEPAHGAGLLVHRRRRGIPAHSCGRYRSGPDLTAGNVVAGTFVMVASDAAVEVEVTQPR